MDLKNRLGTGKAISLKMIWKPVKGQDIVMTINFALGITTPTSLQFYSADVNSDNIIDILDIVNVINIILD